MPVIDYNQIFSKLDLSFAVTNAERKAFAHHIKKVIWAFKKIDAVDSDEDVAGSEKEAICACLYDDESQRIVESE